MKSSSHLFTNVNKKNINIKFTLLFPVYVLNFKLPYMPEKNPCPHPAAVLTKYVFQMHAEATAASSGFVELHNTN